MSFLDKINASPEPTEKAPATKRVNPLLKKKLAAKKEDSPEATAPKKTVLPLPKKEKAQEKQVAKEAQAEEPVAEKAAENTKPVVKEKTEDTKSVTKKETDKSGTSPEKDVNKPKEKMAEPKKETPKKVSKESEEKPKAEPAKKATPDKAEEPKPVPKKKSSAKTAKNPTAKKQASANTPTDIPTTDMSFNDAVISISSSFEDDDWNEFKEEVQNELSAIVIADDMNPGTLKVVISELSILREKVWFSYQEQKTLYERLSSKDPEGLIERIKRVNLGSGNNDMERRKAGVLACMQHNTGEGDVNLYEILDETRSRYNFLRSVIDSIKYKTDVLITLNGALKLEKEHL